MSEQTFRTNETELAVEEINDISSEEDTEETEVTKEPTLKERVFKVCDTFETEGKKITRDAVRAITGGSDRDLSKYLKEWRQTKNDNQSEDDNEDTSEGALVIQTNSNIEVQSNGEMVQGEEVETIKTRVVKRHIKATTSAVISGANRAANVLLTEEKTFQYLMENPDQLPEDVKQEVEKAMNESEQMMTERMVRFEVNFFVEEVLAGLHGKG